MSYKFNSSTVSPSNAVEDSKWKPAGRLSDNSWIRKDEEEDEDVDRDPNFGSSILGHHSVIETSKRFGGSQDELNTTSSSPTSYRPKVTSYQKSSTAALSNTRSPRSSSSSYTESPRSSSTTTTSSTANGKTTETITTTARRSGTLTDRVFSDDKSTFKGSSYSLPSSRSKVTETTTITSSKEAEDPFFDALTDSKLVTLTSGTKGNSYTTSTTRTSSSAEDQLYGTLIPAAISKSDPSSVSTSVTRTSYVTVESPKVDVFPSTTTTTKSYSTDVFPSTTTTTKSYSTPEDKLYDTLLPRAMSDLSSSPTSTTITRKEVKTVESPISDQYNSYSSSTYSSSSSRPNSTSSYSSSRPDTSYEYTTNTSPSVYTTTSTKYKDERMNEYLDGDSSYTSRSSIKTLYSAPERTVLEKDLCTYCRKPFNAEAKMVLDDMKIQCHASCFKCEVCSNTLGNLKAGDSIWIYRRTVQCESCFDATREKWHR